MCVCFVYFFSSFFLFTLDQLFFFSRLYYFFPYSPSRFRSLVLRPLSLSCLIHSFISLIHLSLSIFLYIIFHITFVLDISSLNFHFILSTYSIFSFASHHHSLSLPFSYIPFTLVFYSLYFQLTFLSRLHLYIYSRSFSRFTFSFFSIFLYCTFFLFRFTQSVSLSFIPSNLSLSHFTLRLFLSSSLFRSISLVLYIIL